MLKINKTKKGFTLVEMLVAIAVFMIVMTAAVGSLISIIDANRKAQSIKNVVNNINFAIESISKDMRVGTKFFCYDGSSYTLDGNCPLDGGTGVKYTSGRDRDTAGGNDVVHYRFFQNPIIADAGNIQRCIEISGNNCSNPPVPGNANGWESLTAPTSNVNITNMRFYVLGKGTNGIGYPVASKKQPRVLMTLEGTAGSKESIKTTFNMQTTVSQRALEAQE